LADRAVFKGYALQGIDGKGRVALPASMRLIVEGQKGERTLLLSDDDKRGCLRAADPNWSSRLYDRLTADADRALDAGIEIDREDIAASAFGRFDEVPFDASGRFILPPFLRNKGALTSLAFFWGAGDTIEVWSPEKLLADPNADAAKKERCAWLMTERGAA
jgi:MraZ protein